MFVTRFAPSPTGALHKGHAFSALTAFEAAKAAGGRFLLRIEDIDFTRCRPDFEAAIYADLAWLGLDWETPVRRQSEHRADYEAALGRLRSGGLLYRCFRTRSEIANAALSAPHGPMESIRSEPLAEREQAQRLAEGQPFVWRLSLARAERALGGFDGLQIYDLDNGMIAADPALGGDVALSRKDIGVAYHLAVVVDDALQGVTHVIRGEDLREAAHVQRLLQALLGLPSPVYRHHKLILGPDGRRLTKRDHAEALAALRERGMTVADLRGELRFD